MVDTWTDDKIFNIKRCFHIENPFGIALFALLQLVFNLIAFSPIIIINYNKTILKSHFTYSYINYIPEDYNNRTFTAGNNHETFPYHKSRRYYHAKTQYLIKELKKEITLYITIYQIYLHIKSYQKVCSLLLSHLTFSRVTKIFQKYYA